MTNRRRRRLWTACTAITIAIGVTATLPAAAVQRSAKQPVLQPRSSSGSAILRRDDIARVARARMNSVVSVHTERQLPSQSLRGIGGPFRIEPIQEGLASGFVIDANGLIVTNAHVVQDVDVVHVRTPNGDDLDAVVIGRDPEDDLALIRAPGVSARPVPLGDSDRLSVGDWVVAIGTPLGLHHTVTTGIISAKARGIDDTGLEFLQTDAALNPGSSGGPLFDLDGKVVGVTTAIASTGGGNVGLNFAIPINTLKAVLPQLRSGHVVHGWLGVVTVAMTTAEARGFGLQSASEGLLVREIVPAGPADRAGIRIGDVLLGMTAGKTVSARDLHTVLRGVAPGTSVTLRVLRDGRQLDVTATLGTRTPDEKNP